MVTKQRSIQEFWQEVKSTREEIKKSVAGSKEQPKDGSCYVVAVRRSGSKVEYGQVMIVRIDLAGVRIEEGFVVLATDAQIRDFKAEQSRKKESLRAAQIDARTTFMAPVPDPKKTQED
jgi:hypothetical protein